MVGGVGGRDWGWGGEGWEGKGGGEGEGWEREGGRDKGGMNDEIEEKGRGERRE